MTSINMDLSQYKNQRHETSYLKLNAFRKDDALCDVILKSTDGHEVRAHKCVLVSHSEYFEKMFVGGFLESTQDVIHIKDISSDVLKNLIDFLYTGELVTIDEDNVEEILNGADILQLEDVRNECIQFYMSILSDDNCLMFKDIADTRGMTELSKECLDHALKRFDFVFNAKSFVDVDIEELTQLIKNDNLNAKSEESVYQAVIKWVKHDESERKHLLPELFSLIRLVYIPQDYLLEKIQAEPLVNSSPNCLKMIKRVMDHLNFEYGDSVEKIIMDAKPRKNTINNITKTSMQCLPRFRLPTSDYSMKTAIDLVEYFDNDNFNNYYPKCEWIESMNEENFHKEWDEEWIGVNISEEDGNY